MKIVILGAGESGIGAAILAQKMGHKIFVSDAGMIADNYKAELLKNKIDFEEDGHTEDLVLEAKEIIKSPGIPEVVPLIQKIRKKGIKVSSEIEFAYRYTKAKIIAITGTNGKTTTSLLTYHLLKEAGLNVCLAGNIGDSFARMVATEEFDYYVLEISSFQLDDIHEFNPCIAILLNITVDHLDRYDNDINKYAASKFRITENMNGGGVLIYNADDENIAKQLNQQAVKTALEPFSASFFYDKKLKIPALDYWSQETENLEDSERNISQIEFDNLPLPGTHNAMNMSAAILAAMRIGLKPDVVKEHLKTFKNAEHRLEEVVDVNGIKFINDSKATNVDAVYYALGSYDKPIIWIAGGKDKGNDYELIKELVKNKVRAIICLGINNKKLIDAFGEVVSYVYDTQDVNDAVVKAYHLAERGDTVLFSPACASFDLFKNYIDRGEKFKEAVIKNVSEKMSVDKKHLSININHLTNDKISNEH